MYDGFPTSSILAVSAALREYSFSFSEVAGVAFKLKMMWLTLGTPKRFFASYTIWGNQFQNSPNH